MLSKIALSVSLLAAASQVSAQVGSSIVKNRCSNDVYMWLVSDTPGDMITIPSGKSVSNAYQTNPDGGGISIKLSTEQDGPITQFEYTLGTGAFSDLFYDISNINGYPFIDGGLSLIPSDSSCRSVLCPSGVVCTLAYNQPDDNEATAACGVDSDMTLVLCSGGSSDISEDSPAAPSSSAAPAPTPAATEVATPAAQIASPTSTSEAATSAPPASTEAPAPASSATSTSDAPGYVATTFVTEVQTVYATAEAAEATENADASFYHHPASLGEFWSPDKRDAGEAEQARPARPVHRHHFRRHAEEAK